MHEAKAASEAAKKLPVGFISQDVKKERALPPPEPTMKAANDTIPFGFIAEDVKKERA